MSWATPIDIRIAAPRFLVAQSLPSRRG
jgi:hypothetical protein